MAWAMPITGGRLYALLCLLCLWADGVQGYPSYMVTSRACDRTLTAGTSIMGAAAVDNTLRTLFFQRGGSVLTCGGTYIPGESLTAHISDTTGKYVFEVSGAGTSGFAEGGCTDKVRIADASGATVVAPASGTLSVKAGWAKGYGAIKITGSCTLTAATTTTTEQRSIIGNTTYEESTSVGPTTTTEPGTTTTTEPGTTATTEPGTTAEASGTRVSTWLEPCFALFAGILGLGIAST